MPINSMIFLPLKQQIMTDRHMLDFVSRVMQLPGWLKFDRDSDRIEIQHGYDDVWERVTPGRVFISIRLDNYYSRVMTTSEDLNSLLPVFTQFPHSTVLLDDYCMLMLEKLYSLEWRPFAASEYGWHTEADEQIAVEEQSLECIDAFIHRIHAPDVPTGYSDGWNHLTLNLSVLWYAQFVPLQRASDMRLGERFLLEHVMNAYRKQRR